MSDEMLIALCVMLVLFIVYYYWQTRPKVYLVDKKVPGSHVYNFTPADGEKMAPLLGATVATLAQVTQAQANGAEWCHNGFVADGDRVFPMQKGKAGCGHTGININSGTKGGITLCGPLPAWMTQGRIKSILVKNGLMVETDELVFYGGVRISYEKGVKAIADVKRDLDVAATKIPV